MTQDLSSIELEYRIYDGGSSDGSQETLRALEKEFPEISLHIEADDGQADALRKGFADGEADICSWLNADDLLLPDALQNVVKCFKLSGAEVVYGDAWFINEADQIVGAYPTATFDRDLLHTNCFLSQPSTFFLFSAYRAVSGIRSDLNYCMDYDLWLRLSLNGSSFARLSVPLSATRLHEGTKTAEPKLSFTDEIRSVMRTNLGEIPFEWDVYRHFRVTSTESAGSAAPLLFLLALIRVGLQQRKLLRACRWGAKLLFIYSAATLAYIRVRRRSIILVS